MAAIACIKEELGRSDPLERQREASFLSSVQASPRSNDLTISESQVTSSTLHENKRSDAVDQKVADAVEKVMSNQSTLHHEEKPVHYSSHNHVNRNYNHHTAVADNLHVADQIHASSANNIFHSSLQKFYEGYKVASHDTERFTALNRSFSDSYNLAKEQLLSPSHFNSRYNNYKLDRKEDGYKSDIIEDRSINLLEKPYGKSDQHEVVEKREKDDVVQGIPIPSFYDNFKLSKDEENVKIGNSCDYNKDEEFKNSSSVLNNSLNDSYRSEDNSSPDSPSNHRGGQFPGSLDRQPHEFSRSFSFHNSAGPNQPSSPYQEGGYPNRRYSLPTPPLSEYFRSPASSTSPTSSSVSLLHASNIHPNSAGIYFCHLCSYSGKCKDLFDEHMSIHFEYSCPHCDYTSRTEGRLKRHIKDFHTNEDPNNPSKVQRTMPGRPKVYRCKQCDFSTITKVDFWQHARSHIKEEKLLQCPRCPFVTEYKHHLEYHLRNHFGSKPFKCSKCNYSCVNKSMLNSHMKSHTNVYQYRCADCTYATKYCHSLKLHLRKYNHKPAAILNNDGSLPQGLDIESAGLSLLAKRGPPRGPRGPRKDKNDHFSHLGPLFNFPMSSMGGMNPAMNPGMNPGMNGGLMSPYWPLVNHMPNGIHPPPPLIPASKMGPTSLHSLMSTPGKMNMMKADGEMLRCNLCAFTADNPEVMNGHVVKVHAHAENQDLFSMFGISSEALLDEHSNKSQQHQMSKPSQPDYPSPSGNKGVLHVHTESEIDGSKTSPHKTSPHSWPHNGGLDPVGQRMQQMMSYSADTHSMPEFYNQNIPKQEPVSQEDDGTDILKQMTLKFGGSMSPQPVPRKETPLDLTKPKSVSPEIPSSHLPMLPSYLKRPLPEEELRPVENPVVQSQDVVEVSPRKRSRKGKAYKLDTLCLKLQEKQSSSPYESESEESIETMATEMRGDREDLTNNVCQTPTSPLDDPSMSNGVNDVSDVNVHDVNNDDNVSDAHDVSNGNCEDNDIGSKSDSDSEGNLKSDLEQIHNNIQFLNSQLKHDSEAKREDYAMDKSEGDAPECHSSPDDQPLDKDPQDDLTDPTAEIVHSVFTNRRKPMTPALRRGTELAWKILNDPSIPMSNPTQSSEIVLETPPRNGLMKPHSNGASNSLLPLSGLPNGISQIRPKGFHSSEHYECPYCDIAFRNCVMYTMHMGYHGYQDPYKCNMCGHCAKDKVDFFLHIARAAHS